MPTSPRQHLTIITGASRGMGLAMAQQRLQAGHVLLCISRQTSDALAHEAQRCDTHLEQWSQDLADPQEAAERLERWLHSLHAPAWASATLINNAGVIPRIGPIDRCDPAELARALRVGLEAPMQLTAAFLRATGAWVGQRWDGPRKVLNISSGLGRRPMAGQAPYCAAKAGMDHFSRCTALDEARRPNGARIVSLAPGVIDTDMQTQLRAGDASEFPDLQRFVQLKTGSQLDTPAQAAAKVLAWLDRPDFGEQPVADVRD
jgi:benzil reductase ((S)-benzoin forming)